MRSILVIMIALVGLKGPSYALDVANPMLPAVNADKFCYPDSDGRNFYCRQDNGDVVWCYPRKNRRYACPREGKKTIWCSVQGSTHYCPTEIGTWWFVN